MNCDEAEELLGAYALDALPEDEARTLREHLAGCPEHAAAAAELRATARSTHALAEPVAAPAALRERVLAAVAREPHESRSVEDRNERSGAVPRPVRRPTDRGAWMRRYGAYGWAAAAFLLVVAAGVLVWNVVLLSGNGGTDAERLARTASVERLAGPGGEATLLKFSEERRAAMIFDRPPLDADHAYQFWRISDGGGRPESIAVARGDASGHVAAVMPYEPNFNGVIAVTVEPAGGSDQPTTAPIFQSG